MATLLLSSTVAWLAHLTTPSFCLLICNNWGCLANILYDSFDRYGLSSMCQTLSPGNTVEMGVTQAMVLVELTLPGKVIRCMAGTVLRALRTL